MHPPPPCAQPCWRIVTATTPTHSDDATQVTLLLILHRTAARLSNDQVEHVLPTLVDVFPQHPSLRCRVAYYDLLAWLYEHRPDSAPDLRLTWRVRAVPRRPSAQAHAAH